MEIFLIESGEGALAQIPIEGVVLIEIEFELDLPVSMRDTYSKP